MEKSTQQCGHPIKPAHNGADRGVCTKSVPHGSHHGNGTCPRCGVVRRGRGWCRACNRDAMRVISGSLPANRQTAGQPHTFLCGCPGILPERRGESNKFARWSANKGQSNGGAWVCRIASILLNICRDARDGKYAAIDSDTPHSTVRKLMDEPLCERCEQPLNWGDLGFGKTPHLHHDHTTGKIHGFTHNRCNPHAMDIEISKLKARILELEAQLSLITAVAA